ncbi:MAG TPA: Uma2 family endonuclease [Virgibacillus sp.]|nr:Uma2 family endonuclease [Virgibacillus sp.]
MEFADENQIDMTYKKYISWGNEERCEVLDGKIISMAPSPIPEHQDISMQLSIEFGTYLRGKTCKTFAAPIDVYLFHESSKKWIDDNVKNWLIPDLIVVCDPDKIKQNRILGAPDLVVEIISPSSAKIDRMDKRLAYQWSGVREYWIIDPANQIIEAYLLKGHALELDNVYNRKDFVPVHVLENLTINTALIFPERTEN